MWILIRRKTNHGEVEELINPASVKVFRKTGSKLEISFVGIGGEGWEDSYSVKLENIIEIRPVYHPHTLLNKWVNPTPAVPWES